MKAARALSLRYNCVGMTALATTAIKGITKTKAYSPGDVSGARKSARLPMMGKHHPAAAKTEIAETRGRTIFTRPRIDPGGPVGKMLPVPVSA